MKFIIQKSVLIAILFAFATNSGRSQETIKVKPNPDKKLQTIEGWGTSLCWWAHMVGQWEDEETIDEIVDLITSPDQLNMNIFRYNIGGGDDPSHLSQPGNPGHMAKGKGVRAEIEGFKASEDADYDWSADAGQRKIMLKLAAKRDDAIFEAFSNSAPYWMTYSGCSAGNNPSTADNVKPEFYNAFGDYLIDVCEFYKQNYNIEFKTLEPFNEPLTNYWGYMGGQEGCHFSLNAQIDFLRVLHPKLKGTQLNTILSASDETDISGFNRTMKAYLEAGDIQDMLGQINTHSYGGSDKDRVEARQLADKMGKTFWQSESGPIGIGGRGLESNLGMAQRMFDDLQIMKPSAWLDWQVIEYGSDVWGLMSANHQKERYRIMKQFYVRMQVTRFIKQGYSIIESGDNKVLMAVSPDEKEIITVLLNESRNEETFEVNLSSIDFKNCDIQLYRTSREENCEAIADGYSKKKILQYSAPMQSISTFVIKYK